jgi:hypothetical protein
MSTALPWIGNAFTATVFALQKIKEDIVKNKSANDTWNGT